MDIAGLPVKKHTFNAYEVESSPVMRRPFSPISSRESSKTNATNILEDLNRKHNDTVQKTIPGNTTPFTTPSKTVFASAGEDNMTLKTAPAPYTPSTPSIPMQTGMTPAPRSVAYIATPTKEVPEEIEYSFEEQRAGFVLPGTHPKSQLQV